MAGPVIVQGTAVASPATAAAEPGGHHGHHGTGGTGVQAGDHQHPPAKTGCNDPIFALLFYGNVAAIVAVAVVYGPAAFDGSSGYDYTGYVYAAFITAIISLIFSGFGLLLNMQYPEFMIKVGLIFVVIMSLVWTVIAFLSGQILAGVIGAVFFLCSLCYARAVWSRIPFAVRFVGVASCWMLLHIVVRRLIGVYKILSHIVPIVISHVIVTLFYMAWSKHKPKQNKRR